MTLTTVAPYATAAIVIDEVAYDGPTIESGSLVLDAMGVPYASGTVTFITVPNIQTLANPRRGARLAVYAGDSLAGSPRLFNLGIQSATVTESTGLTTVTLASDEALLQTYAPLEDQYTAADGMTLRHIIGTVLAEIGAELEPGSTNADMTPHYNLENRVLNPAGYDTWGYVAGNNCDLVGTGSTTPVDVGTYITWRSAAAGDCNLLLWTANAVRPGDWLYAMASIRTGTAGRMARLTLRFRDGEGNTITEETEGNVAVPSGTDWGDVWCVGRAPAGAVTVSLFATGVAQAGGETFAIDVPAMVPSGTRPEFAFNGGMEGGGAYSYAWAGVPHQSVSLRSVLAQSERLPDTLWWKAGVPAWDYLQPLVAATGYRLYCDELRRWWLIDPTTHVLPGPPAEVAGVIEIEPSIARTDEDGYRTGVVVRYRWEDKLTGIRLERLDTAGTPGLVHTVDLAAPYPGPGLAARILAARIVLVARTEITAAADWTVTPAAPVTAARPAGAPVEGLVERVEWGLTDGRMTLTVPESDEP